jgi:hypothetical protein
MEGMVRNLVTSFHNRRYKQALSGIIHVQREHCYQSADEDGGGAHHKPAKVAVKEYFSKDR